MVSLAGQGAADPQCWSHRLALLCLAQVLTLARVAGTFPSLPSAAPQECVDWIGDTPQSLQWEVVV